ncbi:uncharacterized protein LOC107417641 [Ziziphus jujuba]|uniref:Uncharacterized protein LOC107417641 n=1 Tax=Ziziphus jujuba TaxID=326968 RepID=A0A6P4A1A3_ZIZJJ|nr:uncharacterized protein LOC107417641 [Ziziphus jujuba]
MACIGGGLIQSQRLLNTKSKLYFSYSSTSYSPILLTVSTIRSESMAAQTTEKLGIKIQKNPPESKLTQLGVRNWPKWGCPPSKFPWTYEAKETCFLLEGKVKVTPAGANESVEIGAGDLVEFPKGMSCTWDVSVAVDKHYNFS